MRWKYYLNTRFEAIHGIIFKSGPREYIFYSGCLAVSEVWKHWFLASSEVKLRPAELYALIVLSRDHSGPPHHHTACHSAPQRAEWLILTLCMHAYEMHTYKIHAHKTHAREMHAHEVHAHEVHAHETHAREVHIYETHDHETHAHKTHAHEMYVHEMYVYRYTPVKHTPIRHTPMKDIPMR
jgi:hypothetical protein